GALLAAVVLGLAAFGVLQLFRSGFRTGRKVERGTRRMLRIGTVLGAAGLIGGVIVGLQWVLLRPAGDPVAVGVVLGMPAVFAGLSLARFGAIAVAVTGRPGRKRGRR